MDWDILEGRNPVYEALSRRRRRVDCVWLDDRARVGPKIARILELCEEQGVVVERVPRSVLDKKARGDVHNGVMARAQPHPHYTVASRLDALFSEGTDPFFILADEVVYEQNLGAILRSAMGAGVNGLVIPVRRGKGVTPVVSRVAMGGAEEVPVIREGISSALKRLNRAGVRVVGADMDGTPFWDVDLTGPLAIVLGGESKGLTSTVRQRCDSVVQVPLQNELDSLNVSVTAGVLLFERVRQLGTV
ncbi:MAG: 23S rRNA (guanosine(2251)-2'-O)-methyltransferase RlmB [Myxococcota bacterium]|nr:23S rRNA (guanosine(2251)-2'-O)-methyltransferase RlmB [Myxococcota bacterium]